MKRITSLLLALILCFTLASCGSVDDGDTTDASASDTAVVGSSSESKSESTDSVSSDKTTSGSSVDSPDESETTPLLYKVTDVGGNTAWLFGSIHVGRESFYPLPDYVIDAYKGADCLAVEFDIKAYESDLAAQTQAMSCLVDLTGNTVDKKVDKDIYNEAVSIMEDYGMYNSFLDLYVPAMWSMLIDNILYEEMGVRTDLGIDRHMLELAYEDGKTILDVESAEFQYSMFAGFSDELQEYMLKSSVEAYNSYAGGDNEAADELDELIDLWAAGDEESFVASLYEEYEFESDDEKLLCEEYNKAVITDRNIAMADFAEDAIASGEEVFICVGAAHIVGEGAMADLLAERGYNVELITE